MTVSQLAFRVKDAVADFIKWLDSYGENSQDHQDFYIGRIGRRAKALYYRSAFFGLLAVAPMVFCEAFIPKARALFHRRMRLPIADAHYAMGFALLFRTMQNLDYYRRAVHFLEILKVNRCENFQQFGWGYPFDWQTRNGVITAGIPLITTTPYCYEAFEYVFRIDGKEEWREIMRSVAMHVFRDYKDYRVGSNAQTCTYTPYGGKGVVNAGAYRAYLLTSAWFEFGNREYLIKAERNLNFVLQSQQKDGSWPYAIDGKRDFIDHFHTCFILKALAKIEKLTGHKSCQKAIENGIRYYVEELFDDKGLPKPFSNAPRLTVYRNELYDYAECINLCVLLKDRFKELNNILRIVLDDLMYRWQKPDGSFRSRKLFLGWDNVPMHRWAQSQLFRSLCFLLYKEIEV